MTEDERRRERHRRVSQLFQEAKDLSPEGAAKLLDEADVDEETRAQVEGILAASARTAGPLDRTHPAIDASRAIARAEGPKDRTAQPMPDQIGSYRILSLLGRGGMATVYLAEQEHPQRTVAIKVLDFGPDLESLQRRFEREVRLLGRLKHPGIASIFEAGWTEPTSPGETARPWFAMEHVDGHRLDAHVRANGIDTSGRLDLLAKICDAVEHAHSQGIIHRDLKPANILVDGEGQPKVLDFGVARLIESDQQHTLETGTGVLLGTLPYMSPEQVAAGREELDARSDVYTLGVIAFELLTGRRPHDLDDLDLVTALNRVRDSNPDLLGSVDESLRGAVETIVSTALARDPDRRYSSAGALASDIRRFLGNEAILARPPSAIYQLKFFARRNRTLVTGVVMFVLAVVFGGLAAVDQAVKARRAQGVAERATEQARASELRATAESYRATLAAAEAALGNHDPRTARQYLDAAPAELRGWEWRYLTSALDDSLVEFQSPLRLKGSTGVASAPPRVLDDGRVLLFERPGPSQELLLWDVEAKRIESAGLLEGEGPHHVVGAALPALLRRVGLSVSEPVEFIDIESGETLTRILPCSEPGRSALWTNADGLGSERRVEGKDAQVVECDWSTGTVKSSMTQGLNTRISRRLKLVATICERRLELRRWPDGTYLGDVDLGSQAYAYHFEFSPRDPLLVTFQRDGTLRWWNVETRQLLGTSPTSHHLLTSIEFSPDGELLATSGRDNSIRLWDTRTREQVGVLTGHDAPPSVSFSPDGRSLASCTLDGNLRLWSSDRNTEDSVLTRHVSYAYDVECSPDGARIASAGFDDTIRITDSRSGTLIAELPTGDAKVTGASNVAWGKAGDRIAAIMRVGRSRRSVRMWNADTGQQIAKTSKSIWTDGESTTLRSLGDTGWLVAYYEEPVQLRHAETLTLLETYEAARSPVLLTSDERGFIARRPDNSIAGFRLGIQEPGATLVPPGHPVRALALSGDGRLLAVGRSKPLKVGPSSIELWDVMEGRRVSTGEGHGSVVHSLAFSPDGKRLASGGTDGVVKIWSTDEFTALLRLKGHTSYVHGLSYTPDGEELMSASGDGTVRRWSTATARDLYKERLEREAALASARRHLSGFSEGLGNPADVIARIRSDTSLDALEREVALQLVLSDSVASQ